VIGGRGGSDKCLLGSITHLGERKIFLEKHIRRIVMIIEKDKKEHMIAGCCICIIAGVITHSIVIGFMTATTAALAKEIWDMTGRGTPDAKDLLATILGALAGILVLTLVL
jgi:hypothetical protein